MATKEAIATRFAELFDQATQIKMTGNEGGIADRIDFYSWALSSLNLIKLALGRESPHASAFLSEYQSIDKNNYVDKNKLNAFKGLFLAAKADFSAGLRYDTERLVAAEVFGDLVVLAKTALAEGQHTVATVLACAALEDALKRYAILNGLIVDGKTMEEVVNALKSKGLVSGPQKALLSAMPRIRNSAMHAEWDKITPNEAGSVLGFVEQFLLTQFVSDA
jgi:hypothetical protein